MSLDPVLRARLRPPAVPADGIERPELLARAMRGLDDRLLVLLADAGYGKSTLLAQVAAQSELPVVWISCDAHVGSPSLLLSHLVAGLAERVPGFHIRQLRRSPLESDVEALARHLEEHVAGGVVVVFDDVHALSRETASVLACVVGALPPAARTALASRPPLPLPLAELVTNRAIALGERELALSQAEVVELAWCMGAPLELDAAAELHRRTRGWPAGVVLASQAQRVGLTDAGRGFDQLVQEVLLAQPADVQEFLLDTSVLDRFTPEMAKVVSARPDAAEILASLQERSLFGASLNAEGEWCSYHQLFQASLRQRLARGAPERLAELHRRAGRAWLAAGEPVEGIHHLLAGGDHAAAAASLEPLAEEMAHTAEAETLAGWLEAIPEELREPRPGLVLAEASLLFGRGDYEASSACIERAMEPLLAAGESGRAGLAFLRLLQVALAAGTPERGPELGERWLPRLEPGAILPATRIALRSCYAWAVLRQPADLQEFLLTTAVLDRFSAEMAQAVSGRADAGEVLAVLAARSLFTVSQEAGTERYRHHQLFRTFLRQRLAREDPERLAELHRRAAGAWLATGEPAAAVPHYLQAGEHELAAEVLEPLAEEMANTTEAETLAVWLEAIPEELRWRRPGLVLAEASLLFDRGACETYFARIERAMEQLLAAGEAAQAGLVLSWLVLAAMASGTGARGCAKFGERLARADMPAPARPAIRLLVAISHALCGRFGDAERVLQAVRRRGSKALGTEADLVAAFCVTFPTRGPHESMAALGDARPEPSDGIPFVTLYSRLFRSHVLNALGRHEEALAIASSLEALEPRHGAHSAVRELCQWEQARALAGLERWDELEALLSGAQGAQGAVGDGSLSYHLRPPAALLASERGRGGAVAMHVAAAKVELAGQDVVLHQPETLCDLSVASWLGGVPQLARELAAEALAISVSLGMPWSQARAALLGALVTDDGATGDALLTDALILTQRHDYQELWTRRERSQAPRLLARALERELGPPGVAAELVAACGAEAVSECVALLAGAPPKVRRQLADAAGEAAAMSPEMLHQLRHDLDPGVRRAATRSHAKVSASERPALRFIGLGGFAVHRGDELVPSSAFGRQRARALLAALLCAGRPVHREELLDWFWSDLDVERGLRALHVTLYGLRRALEPELRRGAGSSVVVAEGESYRMRPADGDSWDAAEFLELVRVGTRIKERDARLEALRSAEAAYTGPLFPEWPYDRWSEARRMEVANALRTALAQLGEDLTDAGMLLEAIACYQRLTALEPEGEAWHRALMVTYARAGERAFALRQYHACRKVLREELGVEASAETRDLYQEILNGRGAAR